MTLSTWFLYAAAVLVLTVTPGPSVLMCISTSVQHGPRRAISAALGSTTAIACIMLLSMLGLGTVLAASETLFTALKWLGAAYLGYLGIRSIFSKTSNLSVTTAGHQQVATSRGLFVQGLMVGASNPKALLFFGALFPQFIDPSAPRLGQFLVLGLTFICFKLLWLSVYSAAAARARRWLQKPGRALWFNRVTGGVFLMAAGFLASARHRPS